jgi:hypothetical protein
MRDEKRKGFAVDDSIVAITYNWTGLEDSTCNTGDEDGYHHVE